MSVVNCRVKCIREQGYNNLKEWMLVIMHILDAVELFL